MKWCVLAALLLLGVVLSAHAERVTTRDEDPLDEDLADRASLMFRAMDKNRDKMIDADDARASEEQLELHMPGITPNDFVDFIEIADKNGDHKLTRSELFSGLADGISQSEAPSLVETDAQVRAAEAKKGFFGALGRMAKRGLKAAGNAMFGRRGGAKGGIAKGDQKAAGRTSKKADACVMCQYIVERIEANIKQSGVIPAMSVAQGLSFLEIDSSAPDADENFSPYANSDAPAAEEVPGFDSPAPAPMPELDSAVQAPEITIGNQQPGLPDRVPAVPLTEEDDQPSSFLETEQLYLDQTAAGIIGSTRQSTRVQRQLERQKYNEIYRVVDISLDDVCEQGMPNSFYGFCKMIYKVQSDVVDGLRYQYRPADICFRVGMCGKKSYITKGIHSRYKK